MHTSTYYIPIGVFAKVLRSQLQRSCSKGKCAEKQWIYQPNLGFNPVGFPFKLIQFWEGPMWMCWLEKCISGSTTGVKFPERLKSAVRRPLRILHPQATDTARFCL